MSQCVPSWDLDDNPRLSLRSNSNSTAPDVPMLDYEVAELTWENGQLAMHGLGPPRLQPKPITSTSPSKCTWSEKPRTGGTLESIVNQATRVPHRKPTGLDGGSANELVPWLNQQRQSVSSASPTMTMDALVPCSNPTDGRTTRVTESGPDLCGTCVVGCSTRVGSCSGAATQEEDVVKRARVARVPVAPEWSREHSVSGTGSATFGRESQHVTLDTCDVGFTSTSLGSPGNTSTGQPSSKANTGADDHDSFCHTRPQREAGEEDQRKKGTGKSSVSTKRSRAAAIHNQSERKRRDKINQRMKTLQKLVPNSSKTDKASMLDEVIEYLKQLQAQIQMMSRMNVQPMMLPMAMQQQLQMSMMAPMAIGMGLGMGMGVMDVNNLGRSPNMTTMPPVLHPSAAAFMSMVPWDGSGSSGGDRLPATPTTAIMPDSLSTYLACQSQPMTMDAYSRMAAMYQPLQQNPASSSRN